MIIRKMKMQNISFSPILSSGHLFVNTSGTDTTQNTLAADYLSHHGKHT